MNPNQLFCKDCDYFGQKVNMAQTGPICMFAPPEAIMLNGTDGAGKPAQTVVSIRPPILDPVKEYCAHAYSYERSRLRPPGTVVPITASQKHVQELSQRAKDAETSGDDNA